MGLTDFQSRQADCRTEGEGSPWISEKPALARGKKRTTTVEDVTLPNNVVPNMPSNKTRWWVRAERF